MLISNVRLSFPNIWKASAFSPDQEAKFSAMLIVSKNSDAYKKIKAEVKARIEDKWGEKPSTLKVCVRDGEEKADKDGFGDDVVFFTASNKTRPTVVDRDRTPLAEEDGKPYAGCYVDAVVDFWAQDNQFGKRINATLKGVQFRGDGDRFGGGGPASQKDFEDLSNEEPVTTEGDDDDFLG